MAQKRSLAEVFGGGDDDDGYAPAHGRQPEAPLMYLPGADDSDDDPEAMMARGARMASFMRGSGPKSGPPPPPLSVEDIRAKLAAGASPAEATNGVLGGDAGADYMDFEVADAPAAAAAPRPPPPEKPMSAREREAASRAQGLETPLDESNLGYRMMQNMGYGGGGLGKGEAGVAAPINPQQASVGDTQGLGRARAAQRAQTLYEDAKRLVAARQQTAFANHAHRRARDSAFSRAAGRARKACRDLDERAGLLWTPLWPPDPDAAAGSGTVQQVFSDASGERYSRPLEEDETAPEGLDAAPPEVALRTAVAYLLDVHNYSLSRGGGLIGADVPTLDEEVAQLLEDEED